MTSNRNWFVTLSRRWNVLAIQRWHGVEEIAVVCSKRIDTVILLRATRVKTGSTPQTVQAENPYFPKSNNPNSPHQSGYTQRIPGTHTDQLECSMRRSRGQGSMWRSHVQTEFTNRKNEYCATARNPMQMTSCGLSSLPFRWQRTEKVEVVEAVTTANKTKWEAP